LLLLLTVVLSLLPPEMSVPSASIARVAPVIAKGILWRLFFRAKIFGLLFVHRRAVQVIRHKPLRRTGSLRTGSRTLDAAALRPTTSRLIAFVLGSDGVDVQVFKSSNVKIAKLVVLLVLGRNGVDVQILKINLVKVPELVVVVVVAGARCDGRADRSASFSAYPLGVMRCSALAFGRR
jgi:hypothetical protein